MSLKNHKMACLILVALFAPIPTIQVRAQESEIPEIATDRPEVGLAPEVVPEGMLQMETGVGVGYTRGNYVADFPESLTRWGIGHHLELRATSSNAVFDPNPDPGVKKIEFQDFSFGAKAGLSEAGNVIPQAVVASLSCPTGGDAYTSGSFDPSVILVWQQKMRRGFVLTENMGGVRTTVNDQRKILWGPGVVLGHGVTNVMDAFLEYAPSLASGVPSTHVVDGGFTYRMTPNSQIDVRVGYQQDGTGGKNLFSLGYSRRLDRLGLTTLFHGVSALAD
jgi:hypothetical protein